MATGFDVQVREDVVIVVGMGMPAFDEVNNALASAIDAARDLSKNILFDHRLLDLSNYYSYIVRSRPAYSCPVFGVLDLVQGTIPKVMHIKRDTVISTSEQSIKEK